MVDLDAPLFHHLLELTVADRICDAPAHAPEDDVPLKMAAFKIDHRELSPLRSAGESYTRPSRAKSCDRTGSRAPDRGRMAWRCGDDVGHAGRCGPGRADDADRWPVDLSVGECPGRVGGAIRGR